MIRRFSSRLQKLDTSFINDRLKGAVSYDRIAGYFRSSMLEVAGEKLEELIDSVKPKHPFDARYNQITEIDWDSCSNVLNADEKRKILLNEW